MVFVIEKNVRDSVVLIKGIDLLNILCVAIFFHIFLYSVLSSKPLFSPSRLSVHMFVCLFVRSFVTLQRFISLIAPEAPTALVPGAPEPRIYPRIG